MTHVTLSGPLFYTATMEHCSSDYGVEGGHYNTSRAHDEDTAMQAPRSGPANISMSPPNGKPNGVA